MHSDFLLVIGLMVVCLSVPAFMSAWADRRTPRAGVAMGGAGALMVVVAIQLAPFGYTIEAVPSAFARVAMAILD